MINASDKRQVSHRYGATWGEVRDGSAGYYKYYAANLDDIEVLEEYVPLPDKEQVIRNAYGWARNNYPDLDQEELQQEIDIKAWMLEEAGEFNYELNAWARPAYVMTALKNAVHDYARKEIGFRKACVVDTKEVDKKMEFSPVVHTSPGQGTSLTFKTAKAAILLYLQSPEVLSVSLQEEVVDMLSLMTEKEKEAVLLFLTQSSNKSVVTRTDRAIKRVMAVLGMGTTRTASPNKNHAVVVEDDEYYFQIVVQRTEEFLCSASPHNIHNETKSTFPTNEEEEFEQYAMAS